MKNYESVHLGDRNQLWALIQIHFFTQNFILSASCVTNVLTKNHITPLYGQLTKKSRLKIIRPMWFLCPCITCTLSMYSVSGRSVCNLGNVNFLRIFKTFSWKQLLSKVSRKPYFLITLFLENLSRIYENYFQIGNGSLFKRTIKYNLFMVRQSWNMR